MRKFLIGAFGVVALATSAVAQQGQQVYACKVIDTEGNEQYICYVRQSYDPNEMAGPAGVGAQRFVKPGEPMDYTIYFENQTNATAAAIKIAVTLPKDANLDWSTLELGEVVFGDHTDTGFVDDKTVRSIKYALADSGCEVHTTVTETDSDITWNLRIWDPTTADHFPDDFNKGVLPPNDPETHCGEGHISFRVYVKNDAVPNTRINASASIVFDDNPAIVTDPAWWNTVGTGGASFSLSEVMVNEGETATIRVNGGSADAAASVKVYLTYNTAVAADMDLKMGTVADGDAARSASGPYQTNLKFPLTLSWAAGEIGDKVITIPIKTDKTVEDDEFFTLQLADTQGMELGEERVCTVTIRDMNDKTLKAAVTAYKPKKGESVATNSVTVAGVSYDAEGGVATQSGGFVAGTGEYTSKSKLTLTAEARPGWAFVGWRLSSTGGSPVQDGEILSTKAKWQVVVTNDAEYVAVFEKIPYVRGLADPADGGKVSGSGLCAAGKKVTLKASANKGFVFVGWVRGGHAGRVTLPGEDDGGPRGTTLPGFDERLTPGAIEYVATTPSLVIDRSAKPTKNSATSTTITNVTGDATYYACFITSEEDKGSIVLAVNGEEMRLAGDGSPHQTNVWCGVYLEWPVAASALSETKVKVAGLPSGLKFTDKPVTSKIGSGKTAVVVTNVLANTIYGAPTAASKTKVDKNTGAVTVTPSAVKVTVTTAGKSSQTYQIDTVVEPLPAWAVGTFAGGVFATDDDDGSTGDDSSTGSLPVQGGDDSGTGSLPVQDGDANAQPARSTRGTVSLTVSAAGKVSGKALGDGLTYTLAAPYYSRFTAIDDGEGVFSNFLADVTASWSYKDGNKTVKTNEVAQMSVQDNGVGGVAAGEAWTDWQYNWKVDPWKTLGKKFDKQVQVYAIREDSSFIDGDEAATVALDAEVTGRVTLKFAASGTVSVSGEFVTGYDTKKNKYTTVKATGSAILVPVDEAHGEAFIYLTPKGLTPHARCVGVPWPKE